MTTDTLAPADVRNADPRVHQLFVERWSPRAFDESEISAEDLAVIFEAAGLAPSAFNYQPWKFLYARRGDTHWDTFLSGLIPFNQSWAKDSAVLVYIVSDTRMIQGDTDNDHYSHSFDAGAAWAHMALQATAIGYHAHAMTGLDFERAREVLQVPDRYRVEAAVAIGRRAEAARLPEGLREREVPTTRKSLGEVAVAGPFA